MEISSNQILDYFNFKGVKVLDEEMQNKLREIVKCAVCFEIPKAKDLKVLTCEQGHHFCSSCYKNLKHCAICRGQFFLGRNFVVEELITQLGPSLGLTKSNIPRPEETPNLAPGKYKCLHMCCSLLKGSRVLNHIRKNHKQNLIDNVQSNPYLKRFDWMFDVTYSLQNIYALSVQISDMGLFTVVININDGCLTGSLHSLTDNSASPLFQYKLTVKINKIGCCHEFSISNCDLHDYSYDINNVVASGKYLKIETTKLSELVNVGENFQVMFSIWRRKEKESEETKDYSWTIVLPENPALFSNDRQKRRNRQRNIRNRKLKLRLREIQHSEHELQNQMQNLRLDCHVV